MSQKDEKTEYELSMTDVPPLEEEFSLEEILSEYGNSREQKIMEGVEKAVQEAEASEEKETEDAQPPAENEESPADLSEALPETWKQQAVHLEEEAAESNLEEETVEPELPVSPQPISLEEVVGSTVDAVLEECTEPIMKPRRGLFSRRKLEDTEQLRRAPEPEPEPEEEPIGDEEDLGETAEIFQRKFQRRKSGLFSALTTSLIPVVLLAAEQYGVEVPMWSGDPGFQSIVVLVCLAATMLLCRDVFFSAISMLKRKRMVGEFLVALSAIVSAGDCVACLVLPSRSTVSPYGAVACLALVFAQWGISRESRGMYDTLRAAAVDDEPPYLVTDTQRGACKQQGAVPGFYTAVMRDHETVLWQTALLPVILMASVVFAGLSSFGQDRGADFLLNWSAVLAAGATFSLPLCWGLPFSSLARHLRDIGCAVAGWHGAEKISRSRSMIVTDTDLFPPGTIQLNGIKIYGEERKKVMSYAATMARCAGSGLERLFDGLLRGELGQYETAYDFSFYEEGGYSAAIHGESVLLGTASFMRKMDVRLPGDIKLKTGIFLALDCHLVAVFAVKYNPAENVDFALRMMRQNHILPILAARDPNITPALLKRKFHKQVRVEYPDLTTRVALSEAEKDRDLPRALLFREGLLPYAETVVGSRRMCKVVRQATVLSLIGSVAGTLLAFYLVSQNAYDLLRPLMLEVFLLLWVLPVLLLADRIRRY